MFVKNIALLCTLGVHMAAAQQYLGDLENYVEDIFVDERDQSQEHPDEDNFDLSEEERRLERQLADDSQVPEDRNYFRSDFYIGQSAEQKLADIWSVIGPDSQTENNDVPMDFYWKEFNQLLHENSNGTFCINSDEMRRNRLKTTHTQGVVAKIRWEQVDNNMGYTGIYASGSDTAVIRLSQTTILTEHDEGLFPSLAIKFLIDGGQSKNLFAMPNFKGTDNWDFFGQDMKSRVEPLNVKDHPIQIETIVQKLIEGSNRPFATAVSGPAMVENNGDDIAKGDVGAPYELVYQQNNDDLHFSRDKELDEDGNQVSYLEQLQRIPVGTTLLEVHARAEPESIDGGLQHIANIVLETPLMTSLEGDRRLFFKHDRVQSDYKYWPKNVRRAISDPVFVQKHINKNEWPFATPYEDWPTDDDDEAQALYNDQIEKFGCPFGWLVGLF